MSRPSVHVGLSQAPDCTRWLLWWKCRECGAELYMHDPAYKRKHDRACPVLAQLFPPRYGFDRSWRGHVWSQQELTEHDCDCNTEPRADTRTAPELLHP